MFSWFAAAVIAASCAAGVALLVHSLGIPGLVLGIGCNLTIRLFLKRRADAQVARVREAAHERRHPELYAEEYEE
jgi:Flp pilus assembly protein TadB